MPPRDLGLKSPRTPSGKPSTSKDKPPRSLSGASKAHGNEQKVTFLEAILGLSGARNIYGTVV